MKKETKFLLRDKEEKYIRLVKSTARQNENIIAINIGF